jgi:hypothetical protein
MSHFNEHHVHDISLKSDVQGLITIKPIIFIIIIIIIIIVFK